MLMHEKTCVILIFKLIYDEINMIFFSADATWFGPDIKTHAFPSPALWGHTLRLECIAYGT